MSTVSFDQILIQMDRAAARRFLEDAAPGGLEVHTLDTVVLPAMERIGADWAEGRLSLAQVYMAGRIAEDLAQDLAPSSNAEPREQGVMAVAVLEDHHELGKRLVLSALRTAGWKAIDYGGGISVDDLAARAVEDEVQVLLVSTLMLPAALRVRELKERLAQTPHPPRILVGGAPFRLDPDLWREVGADAMGRTSADALSLVRQAMEEIA